MPAIYSNDRWLRIFEVGMKDVLLFWRWGVLLLYPVGAQLLRLEGAV